MRKRLPVGVVVVIVALTASGMQTATAWECVRPDLTATHIRQQLRGAANCTIPQGDRAALAARQDLRDEVRMAMADGQITPKEHCQIICDASLVLCPEELEAFEEYLNAMAQCPADLVAKATPAKSPLALERSLASVKSLTKLARSPARKTAPVASTDNVAPLPPDLSTSVAATSSRAAGGGATKPGTITIFPARGQ